MRVLWSEYLRSEVPDQHQAGLFLGSQIRWNPHDGDYAQFIADFDDAATSLADNPPRGATFGRGALVNDRLFSELHLNYDILLFGESHDNLADVDLVLAVADFFVRKNRSLIFMLEHIPGSDVAERLATVLMRRDLAVDDFLERETFASLGNKSPLAAWERLNQKPKLVKILQFAKQHGIPASGHDLPFDVQNEHAMRSAMLSLQKRDEAMAETAAQKSRQFPRCIIFCFVGAYHLEPQMTLFNTLYRDLDVVALNTRLAPAGGASSKIHKSNDDVWEVQA